MEACGVWSDGVFGEIPVLSGSGPPPFLGKTYDMVDDPLTDAIVSWAPEKTSFVVWNPAMFARDLLPKYFKHNNFSSFVRQLNTYGFRKIDPDRWEFANDGFLKGWKHLLTNINRRKPTNTHNQQLQPLPQKLPVASCIEVGNFGLDEEIEMLKRDKNVLMQELIKLRQQQQTTNTQLQALTKCFHGMEQKHQQMVSFLAKAIHSPDFLAQLVQQDDNHNTQKIKKRKFINQGELEGESAPSDGQIIKHQLTKSLQTKKLPSETPSTSDSSNMPIEEALDPASFQESSGVSTVCSSAIPDVVDIVFQELAPVQGIGTNESTAEFLSLSYPGSETESIGFSPLAGVDGMIPLVLENIPGDAGIDEILNASVDIKLPDVVDSFWEQLLSEDLTSRDVEVGRSMLEAIEMAEMDVNA